jgi:hypothetical protein
LRYGDFEEPFFLKDEHYSPYKAAFDCNHWAINITAANSINRQPKAAASRKYCYVAD